MYRQFVFQKYNNKQAFFSKLDTGNIAYMKIIFDGKLKD